jgi:hypothetical protein
MKNKIRKEKYVCEGGLKKGQWQSGNFFKQQNFIQLVKQKIDSVKLVH